MSTPYDIVIVGGGPAGLTAAIYGARAGKSVLVIEKDVPGGKINETPFVENIPGFTGSGAEFGTKLFEQAESQGVEFAYDRVVRIKYDSLNRVLIAGDEDVYEGKTCIIATGTKNRTLGLPNEEKLIGKGIHFCATCDGPFYKNKNVVVVGGGNSAITEAIELASIAKSVTVLQNLHELTAEKSLIDKLNSFKNVIVYTGVKILEYVLDGDSLKGIWVEGLPVKAGDIKSLLEPDGIFLAIGLIPQNDNFRGEAVSLDSHGYIQITMHQNIFACGDCTDEKIKQVAVACGAGAKTAIEAVNYLNELE